jgi:hypothetical protein
MKIIRALSIFIVFLSVSGFTECYKPVTNSGLPKNIRKIAVPAFQFEAKGMRYRVESRFTEAVTREIIRRGNGLQVTIVGAVTIRDLKDDRILYDNQNFVFRDSFEFSEDPRSFFNEEDPAVDRMSRAFAESVVSAIINGIGVSEEKR